MSALVKSNEAAWIVIFFVDYDMGVDDDFKGLCTVPRSPVGADRLEALIDLRIFISSDWRSMGVTPRLDI